MEKGRDDPRVAFGLAVPLRALAHALAELGVPGMLFGELAAIVRGVPRATRDVDATVAGGERRLEDLVAGFGRHGIVPRIVDAVEFASQCQVLLLRHSDSNTDDDVTLAWLPFELEAIRSAELLAVGGTHIAVARPEDLVI